MQPFGHMLTASVFAASAITGASVMPASAKTLVYVSNAQDGEIASYALDSKTGALTSLGKTKAGKNVMPMAISPNKKVLYVSVRSEPFTLISYAIDPATGALAQKSSAPLPDSMAYISTDSTGRFLFAASYGGHKISVSPIGANGLVEAPAAQVIETGRNAHAIIADRTNKFVYATNLGSGQIMQFRFDAKTGKLTPNTPPLIKARADHGPRHMRISSDNKFMYQLSELMGTVTTFALEAKSGLLTEVSSASGLPPDSKLVPGAPRGAVGAPGGPPPRNTDNDIWAADIHMTPDGRFLYITERTSHTLAAFSVDGASGKLTYLASTPTERPP